MEKYSIVLPLLLIKKNYVSATKKNFKRSRQENDRVDKSEIVPGRHVFVSFVGREIEENVPHILSVVPEHL